MRIVSVADKVSDHPSDAEDASYADDQPLAHDGSVITTVYRPDDGSLEFFLDGNSLGIAFARSVLSSFALWIGVMPPGCTTDISDPCVALPVGWACCFPRMGVA